MQDVPGITVVNRRMNASAQSNRTANVSIRNHIPGKSRILEFQLKKVACSKDTFGEN
jgi:hypothetical protein